MVDDQLTVREGLEQICFHLADLFRSNLAVEGVNVVTFAVVAPAA